MQKLKEFRQRFWLTKKEKAERQEFLDRLRGLTEVTIRHDLPEGVFFVVSDESTGYIDNYFKMGHNEWVVWGNRTQKGDKVTRTITTHDLEAHLTDMARNASPNGKVTILDESCCVNFGKLNYEKVTL